MHYNNGVGYSIIHNFVISTITLLVIEELFVGIGDQVAI